MRNAPAHAGLHNRAYIHRMKTLIISLAAICGLCLVTGCTSTTTTAADTTSTRPIHEAGRDVYSKADLDKTGRQTPGEALAQEDPSITVTHR